MKKFSRIILVFIFVLFVLISFISLSGCKGKSQESVQKGDFKVEFLFEVDGCKMYRFKDGTRYVYWVNQTGRVQSDVTRNSGKSSHTEHMESITTNTSENDSLKAELKKMLN